MTSTVNWPDYRYLAMPVKDGPYYRVGLRLNPDTDEVQAFDPKGRQIPLATPVSGRQIGAIMHNCLAMISETDEVYFVERHTSAKETAAASRSDRLPDFRHLMIPLEKTGHSLIDLRFDPDSREIQAFDSQKREVPLAALISATDLELIARHYFATISKEGKVHFAPRHSSDNAAAAASSTSNRRGRAPLLPQHGNVEPLQSLALRPPQDYSSQPVIPAATQPYRENDTKDEPISFQRRIINWVNGLLPK